MIGAVFCFTAMTVAVRMLAQKIPVVEQVAFRSLIVLVVLAPWIVRARFAAIRTQRLRLFVVRAVFIGIGTVTWFMAVSEMPLADAVALHFTLPLFGIVLAIVVLREAVGLNRWIATMVGFGGTLVILRPGFVDIDPIAVVVLLSAAAYAAGAITGKILLRTEAPVTVVFYLNLFIGLFTLIPTAFVWVTPSTADLPAILVIGLSAAAAHTCLARAFAIADASFLLPLEFLRLPVTGFAAYVLFSEIPDRWTLAGAAIIFAGAWYVNLGERRRGTTGT